MKSKRASPERQSEPPATLLRLQNPQDLAREVQQVSGLEPKQMRSRGRTDAR